MFQNNFAQKRVKLLLEWALMEHFLQLESCGVVIWAVVMSAAPSEL